VPGLPDAEVVQAFLEGDAEQIRTIRASMGAVVRAFRFGNDALERELVQEALGRVFLNLSAGRFRGECSLQTYAQRIAKYTCLEHVRRRRFETETSAAALRVRAQGEGPEESLLRAEEHRRNLRALAELPPECRELFRLIFLERLSYSQVAGRLGISEAAVKTRVHRCRLTGRTARTEKARQDGESPRRRLEFGRVTEVEE
jgi:RNA polymerase sigma factor (sigma-70 family)